MSRGLSRYHLRFWYFVEESVSYLLVVQPARVSFRAITRPNEGLKKLLWAKQEPFAEITSHSVNYGPNVNGNKERDPWELGAVHE